MRKVLSLEFNVLGLREFIPVLNFVFLCVLMPLWFKKNHLFISMQNHHALEITQKLELPMPLERRAFAWLYPSMHHPQL